MRLRIQDINTDKLKIIAKKNSKYIKTAMMVATVLIAVLFFGSNGEKDSHITIENNTEKVYAEAETEIKTDDVDNTNSDDTLTSIYCDISGEVINPGVYTLTKGDRLDTLIKLAGGLTDEADIDLINRARILSDGEKVFIPKLGSEDFDKETGLPNGYPKNEPTVDNSSSNSNNKADLVNINTASQDELETIPGIGPVTAEKIISYRESFGLFDSVEDLINVSGIGTKTVKKIAQYVTV